MGLVSCQVLLFACAFLALAMTIGVTIGHNLFCLIIVWALRVTFPSALTFHTERIVNELENTHTHIHTHTHTHTQRQHIY